LDIVVNAPSYAKGDPPEIRTVLTKPAFSVTVCRKLIPKDKFPADTMNMTIMLSQHLTLSVPQSARGKA
jgi:hypothetical protein